jgi:Family of unknown function (DUF6502)
MVSSFLSFLQKVGYSQKRVVAALRTSAVRIDHRTSRTALSLDDVELVLGVGGIVHDWCWDARYTEPENAAPRPLSLERDRDSLDNLIGHRLPNRRIEDVLEWMRGHDIVLQQEDGSHALASRIVLTGSSKRLMIGRTAMIMSQYLQTAWHNVQCDDARLRNLDRTAWVHNLPAKFIPQFREMVETQAQSFLEAVDAWMEGRTDGDRNDLTVEVAVNTFAYTGPVKRKRASKK